MIRIFKQLNNFSLKKTGKIIGIDLGTTNSCVAVMEGNDRKVIENSQGSRTTPSVVAFTNDGQKLIGSPAKRQAFTNSENTVFATKRLIGRKFNEPSVQNDKTNMPYKIVENVNGDAWISIRGKTYSPEQIGSLILGKMKETAEQYLEESINKAVITVPAYFNNSQRQATKDAGRIAGLDVQRIINEPTAAALAYGFERKEDKLIAVYDLGGGTFDISILQINKGVVEVKATNGDTSCGGQDIDGLIQRHLLYQFQQQSGINVEKDKSALQRLRQAAQKAKVELSFANETEINLPFLSQTKSEAKHFLYKLTRSRLQSIAQKFIQKTIDPCKNCIKDAGIRKQQIEEVILVGGMTRMPLVQRLVKKIFEKQPTKSINPDEAVAMGACIQSGVMMGSVKNLVLLDVTPLTLGTNVVTGEMISMIPRNTPIPVKRVKQFTTAEDNQTSVHVGIYQGERFLAKDNKLLGDFVLTGIPPSRKGVPRLQTTFQIDTNGILHVTQVQKSTGKKKSIRISGSGGLSQAQIQRMVKEGERLKKEDKVKKQLSQLKHQISNLHDESISHLNEYKERISSELAKEIQKNIQLMAEWKAKELSSSDLKEIPDKLKKIKQTLMKIGQQMRS